MATPPMRWRRQHKKSKNGCQTCKLRKVKCDETHPACKNCQRLGIACDFQPVPNGDSETPSTFGPCSQVALKPQRSDENLTSRTMDLWLLHHFATVACKDFPDAHNPKILNMWSVAAPQMGFSNEFLLDAILCSSAFHLSTLLPNNEALATAGHKYYGKAVTSHREALATLDRSTADPLCLASVLIMLVTFKISCQPAADECYSPPVEWFRIMNGVGRLIKLSLSYLTHSGIRVLLEYQVHSDETRAPDELLQLQSLNTTLSTLARDLRLCADLPDTNAVAYRQRFWDNVTLVLADAMAGHSKYQIRRRLLGVAALSEESFFHVVEQKDTLTLILLSHYFALLKWAGGNWWLDGSLDDELRGIFLSIPAEYHWAAASHEAIIRSPQITTLWETTCA